MRYKILGLFAAVALVAACETGPDSGATAKSTSFTTPIVKPGTQEDLVVNVGDRVFFDFDKYSLKAKARQTLERQATFLKDNAGVKVALQGHADERGTREYNLALGDRRANAAKDYLMALGINPNRMTIISYGKERPAVAGSNEAAWSQNRRAVTVISEGAGS